jgi:hypothetical protein
MLENFLGTLQNQPSFHRTVRVKDGKTRIIYEPNGSMIQLHNWMIAILRDSPTCPRDYYFLRPANTVYPHLKNQWFYITDLVDAYENVKVEKLSKILLVYLKRHRFKENEFVGFLQKFFFSQEGGLATGGPASPDLFNLYMNTTVDARIKKDKHSYGLTYTRFMDDLIFSDSTKIGFRKRKNIRQRIRAAGFELNESKTRVLDICQEPITVVGIKIEYQGFGKEHRVLLSKEMRSRIQALIYRAMTKGDVDPHLVNGMMSVFWLPRGAKSNLNLLTRSERKIYDLFKKYQLGLPQTQSNGQKTLFRM